MIIVNEKPVDYSLWPGGEIKLKVEECPDYKIIAYLYSSEDIMILFNVLNAIGMNYEESKIDLHIPYFPYARQDRVCEKGEPCGSLMFSRMLSEFNILLNLYIYTYDIHSQNSARLSYVIKKEIWDLIPWNMEGFFQDKVIIGPDEGSERRVSEFCASMYLATNEKTKHTTLRKIRTVNGIKYRELLKKQIKLIKGQDCVIIDDICDGGRTFTAVAKLLRDAGAKDLYLYTTHGIYSHNALVNLLDFKKVLCTFLHPSVDEEYFRHMNGEVLHYEF